jgi:hypothetical protein
MLTVKGTLVLRTVYPFAGVHSREGLGSVRLGVWSPNLMLGCLPMTKGCSGVAEEGNSRNHPRSAGPSLGLLAHRTRATGSRRRKTSSRWMEELCRRRQAFTGESGVGVASSEFVARGLWVSAASGEHTKGTKREEGCGLRHAAGTIARGSCSYVVF